MDFVIEQIWYHKNKIHSPLVGHLTYVQHAILLGPSEYCKIISLLQVQTIEECDMVR